MYRELSITYLFIFLPWISGQGKNCNTGVVIQGLCHILVEEAKTYSEALQHCSGLGLSLASVQNAQFQNQLFLYANRKGNTKNIWIGAREISTYWRWDRDDTVLSPQGCFLANTTYPEFTVRPKLGTIPNLTPEVCISNCSADGYKYAAVTKGTDCFCGNSYGKYGKTDRCNQKCPGSPDHQKEWCGGFGRYHVFGVTGVFADWAYNQPNGWEGLFQLCGIADGNTEMKFQDELCSRKLYYICDVARQPCIGTNYRLATDRCFYVNRTAVNWYQARQGCIDIGGQLSKIESMTEHDKLRAVMSEQDRKKYWIGLYSGTWIWANNEEIQYFNWGPEEAELRAEQCVVMNPNNNYRWKPEACTEKNYFYCQQIPEAPTTKASTSTSTTSETTRKVTPSTPSKPTNAPITNTPSMSQSSTTLPDVGGVSSATDPGVGGSTQGGGLSPFYIALIVLACLLLLLIILVLLIFCCCKNKYIANKVDYDKAYDARPYAPVPNTRRLSEVSTKFLYAEDGIYMDPAMLDSRPPQYSSR